MAERVRSLDAESIRRRDGLEWHQVGLPAGRAVFTTRIGGVGVPPYEGLNLSSLTGEDPARVSENRARLAAAIGFDPLKIAVAEQVHGADLIGPSEGRSRSDAYLDPAAALPRADGHFGSGPDFAAMVMVADCLPVALGGAAGVALVHAGRRGLAGGIIERAVAAVDAAVAVIGVGIGPCCYQVGPEVLAQFSAHSAVARGRMLDLRAVAVAILRGAGVGEISQIDGCSRCDGERYFSHRRDGLASGRHGALVGGVA